MAQARFPRGTHVEFTYEGQGRRYGVVHEIAIINGQEVAVVVLTEHNGATVRVPCAALSIVVRQV
ncbi:hypothetical protein EIP91_001034 [Steccherinum ochraceum]|uniref:KOW domain-containing protein n=1 Tax=Steccherinum ochraceum TaxID=92696 RepID=A0A4R0REM4_9APHY|nr:hypothetical protein EIP91_001034 [Steccherinum ochraceum]